MRRYHISIINKLDKFLAHSLVNLSIDRNSLMTFLFHGILNTTKDRESDIVDPTWVMTISELRQFIEYFLGHNYIFTTPDEIIKGLDKKKKYLLLTFDDGYFNNINTLPILNEYKVPATFFISSNHVLENKSFWWDIIYRERKKRNTPIEKIKAEILSMELKNPVEIELYIINSFGKNAFQPFGDIDKPFSPSELKIFANERFVSLGNHTSNHAVLSNCSPDEIKTEMDTCQQFLYNLTGKSPVIISYPCGWYSKEIAAYAKQAGISLGLTVNAKKNYFPINSSELDLLLLGRFTLVGNRDIINQCIQFRSDIHLKKSIKKFIKKIRS
jgi:peptidoglycan/xylan/chitin deacetylase (PgdA/CDA1 family)